LSVGFSTISQRSHVSSPQFVLNVEDGQPARMKSQGLGVTKIAKALGIGRASVYRVA
jgi:hypothetical protein